MTFTLFANLAFDRLCSGSCYIPTYSFGGGYSSYSSYKPVLFNLGYTNYGPSAYYRTGSSQTSYTSYPKSTEYSSYAPSSYAPSSSSSAVRKTSFGSLTRGTAGNTSLNARNRVSYSGIGSEYSGLSRAAAFRKAKTDSRLEFIGNGGHGWSISNASFQNDIAYASRGTSILLDEVVKEIRKKDPNFNLLVTSALGTSTSPHAKRAGHYDVENVKLDFGGGMSKTEAQRVANQLKSTGKFAFANIECDGRTYHIDAQFKQELLA